MNDDSKSDLAGVTYCNESDLVELWITKYQPFVETGFWARIPGIRYKLLEIEMQQKAILRQQVDTAVNRSD